jgi:hypothetical protein
MPILSGRSEAPSRAPGTEAPPDLSAEWRQLISRAAADFFFFQNRGYPRSAALEWVGNRYRLVHLDRMLLHRGVSSAEAALRRRGRRSRGAGWCAQRLVVDGHNVHITVESALLGRPLLLANDGALRDLAGESAKFRLREASALAVEAIFRFLEELRPVEVLFLFDSPMSHSGALAGLYRRHMKTVGIDGDARAVPVPEREFPYRQCVVASSDSAVMDASCQWLDLAHGVLAMSGRLELAADFSSLIHERSAVSL